MAFVVAGVTGNTGKVVANTLLAQKRAVRVIVRDAKKGAAWKDKGAEVAIADLRDAAALERALAGAESAYVLVPPSMTEPDFRAYQLRTIDAIASAVAASRLPHVVLLSSVGAQHAAGTGPIAALHVAEAKLRAIRGTTTSFVRAGYFMENLGGSLATLGQGMIPSFVRADLTIDMIATDDIGRTAASLLVEGGSVSQIVELGGPGVTMNDVAALLAKITGKPVSVQEAPLDAVVPTFTGFGMPKDLAELYREMLEGIGSGLVAFEGGHRRVQGTTSVEAILRRLLGAG